MNTAWDLAGLKKVCKTLLKGFDSLPRLHSEIRSVLKGVVVYRIALYRNGERFPDDYSKRRLRNLVLFHLENSIKAKTEASNLRERLIEAQKALSSLKRNKEKLTLKTPKTKIQAIGVATPSDKTV